MRTGMIAHLKQRLSLEFPEIASYNFTISPKRGYTPILGWLAEVNNDRRYEKLYERSIARDLNISLSDYTRQHPMAITEIEKRISARYLSRRSCIE
jgi:hypothetical protein